MASIFTKIIKGEIPSYKIYEDKNTYAFLDINPETIGHTLVVPKTEVDKIYDLEKSDFDDLMTTVKKLSKHFEKILHKRIFWKVIGTDVPHAHVHLMPQDENWEHGKTLKMDELEMSKIKQLLEIK